MSEMDLKIFLINIKLLCPSHFTEAYLAFFEEDWVTFFHLVFYANSFHLTGSRQHTFLPFAVD